MDNEDRLDALDINLPSEFDGLDVFAVGGAVRALFTDQPVEDVDLMVAGVNPSEMVDRDFTLVIGGNTPDGFTNDEFRDLAVDAASEGRLSKFLADKDGTMFPVFIDSLDREVALARVERSTGDGHNEFDVVADRSVSVKEDLGRRDLRANAMAVALTDNGQFNPGELIDPFDGRGDINREVLRMVDPQSFSDDPLRILRLARFAARLEFDIDEETVEAAREHVDGLHNLPHERWGMEIVKAFKQADRPSEFISVLDDVNALELVLPEVAALKGVPAGPEEFHREGDALDHTLLVMDEMARLRQGDSRAIFAAMAHDLGKAETPEPHLPSHPKHHVRGVDLMEDIQERLVLPTEFSGVMETASRFHMRMHDLDDLREATLLRMVDRLRDDYNVNNPGDEPVVRHITLDELVDLAVADDRGREPTGSFDAEAARRQLDAARRVLDDVDGNHVAENFDVGDDSKFGDILLQERVKALKTERPA